MKRKLMLVSAAVLSAAMSSALPQPAVWFKADTGVTVEDGKVTKWANQGSLGAVGDLTATGPSISVAENETFGTVLRFGGTDHLASAGTTDLGVTAANGLTYFVVCEFASDVGTHPGLWGLYNASVDLWTRIFFNDTMHQMSSYYGAKANLVQFNKIAGAAGSLGKQLMSVTVYDNWQYGYLFGLKANNDGIWNGGTATGTLYVGRDSTTSGHAKFSGDYAELRIYDQALTAAERFQVECELAAKYGVGINPEPDTAIPAAMLSGCTADTVAFGTMPKGGKPDVEVPDSGTSGALTVSFAADSAVDANSTSLVYVANNGMAGADRVWCIAGASAARAIPLNLTFDTAAGAGLMQPTLQYRQTAEDAWRPMAVSSYSAEGGFSFVLPAGWKNAQYALREKVAPQPTVWFKADDGVSVNTDGQVTKWANRGTLGTALDLVPKNGAGAGVTLTECAAFGNAQSVRLSGDAGGYLTAESGETTDLGVTQDSGATFFQVVNIGQKDSTNHYAVWGLDYKNNGKDRLGVYYYRLEDGAGNGHCYRSHFFNGNANLVDYENVKGKVIGGGLKSAIAFGGVQSAYSSGSLVRSADYVLDAAPKKGVFSIGYYGVATFPPFPGDIAELRVYDRALSAAEKAAVEGELASKYSLAFGLDADTEIPAKILSQYGVSPSAFGSVANGAVRPEASSVNGRSGALSAAFAGLVDQSANALVYLAGDDTGSAWYVGGTAGARAVPLTLTFAASTLSGFSKPTLFFRGEDSGTWKRVASGSGVAGDDLVLAVPAGWSNGEYCFGEDAAVLPSAWFRADTGVTLEGGTVSKWKNLGTLGSALDLAAAGGEKGVTVAQNEQFGTSLRFDGEHYLEQLSAEPTTLGIEASVGGTCIVVCDFGETKLSGHPGLFSLYGGEFGLYFNCNGKYLQMNFFGQRPSQLQFYSKPNLIMGRKIISVTAANDGYSFGSGQCAVVDGLVVSNANVTPPQVQGTWAGTVKSGSLCIGRDQADTHAKFSGDIAEVRFYDHPLTSAEQAAVELELAVKYGFAIPTVGTFDPVAVAGHPVDGAILGAEAFRGPTNAVPMATKWSDGTFDFAFRTTPPPPPLTPEEGAGIKSLTYLGSDGGTLAFAPRSAGSPTEDFGRTWYVASACPSFGGVMTISCDTADAADWKYRLYRKAADAQGFARVAVEPDVGEGTVTFTLESLEAGVYRLTRKPANIGLGIILR